MFFSFWMQWVRGVEMKLKFSGLALLALLVVAPLVHAQAWSGIIDPSRAIDWSNAGIPGGVPNRTAQCGNSIAAYSGPATAINNAIAACGSGQFVLLGAGTFNLSSGITFKGVSNVTLRGSGPTKTIVKFSADGACDGQGADVCFIPANFTYSGSASVMPGGSQSCSWTAGYAQRTTSITLNSCGGTPPVGQMLILDQANDTSDTGGIYVCDTIGVCRIETGNGNQDGRIINGLTHSSQQIVKITGVTGGGPYTVSISPGLYMSNWRASQAPGAWWPGQVTMDGIENLTLDHTVAAPKSGTNFYSCYECWMKNVRSIDPTRNHVWLTQSAKVVIRDSYFYITQNATEESYGIEPSVTADDLIENNIFDHITDPFMFGQGQGVVAAYNYSANNPYTPSELFMMPSETSHNAGSAMNLWEGNNLDAITCDSSWGTSPLSTYFRNQLSGFLTGKSLQTYPIDLDSYCRAYNIVGNVLGQPSFTSEYEAYPPSSGIGACNTSVYELGWAGVHCTSSSIPNDVLVRNTLLRWGNYDTVSAAVRWNSSEIPTTGVPFINGNAVPSTHALPTSFYLSSRPSFWGTPWGNPPWPPTGPDVSGGSGPGGLSYDIPAKLCHNNATIDEAYGSPVLAFDASVCYNSAKVQGPNPPTGLSATVQ
jgi:hypothetical protein